MVIGQNRCWQYMVCDIILINKIKSKGVISDPKVRFKIRSEWPEVGNEEKFIIQQFYIKKQN